MPTTFNEWLEFYDEHAEDMPCEILDRCDELLGITSSNCRIPEGYYVEAAAHYYSQLHNVPLNTIER